MFKKANNNDVDFEVDVVSHRKIVANLEFQHSKPKMMIGTIVKK